MLLSLLGLFQLRLTLRKEARHGHVHPAADSAQPAAEIVADEA